MVVNRQEMVGSPRPNGIVVPTVDQSQIGASWLTRGRSFRRYRL
jgi:hypothetical protein